MLVKVEQKTRGPFYTTTNWKPGLWGGMSGLNGVMADVGVTIRNFWDWFDGTQVGATIAAPLNSVIYRGYGPPKAGPSPGVPDSALTAPYAPTEKELIQAQKDAMANWMKTAFDNTAPVDHGDSSDESWLLYLIAGGLAVWVMNKR